MSHVFCFHRYKSLINDLLMQVESITECSLGLNAGQKYYRREHSVILSTCIKLPLVIKIFVLSIFSGRFTQVLPYLATYRLNIIASSEYSGESSQIRQSIYCSYTRSMGVCR